MRPPKPKVASSTLAGDTSKALLANTAGKAFSLDSQGFSSVARLGVRSSANSDEMTANDTLCPRLPEFGANAGANGEDMPSTVRVLS